MQHTMRLVGESHVALGQYENAYSSLQESTALNDSLYSVQKAKALSEMETKYETEKKEQTIEKQADRLRLQRFIGFSVLSSILLIASILYYRVFQKRKYERKIQQLEVQQKIQSERERISRDLHDHVGANLTKIITDLDLLSLQLDKEQASDKVKKVENTRGFTQNTIRTLRDTIWAMNKDGYSVTEFADKVEAFLGYYLEDYVEWNVHRKLDVDRNLRPTQVLNLLRIIQEATQNMLKYSKAKNYDITIDSVNDVLITIKDEGIGFSLNDKHEDDHYGLYNMEKRANDIEANYKLVTKPTEGVEIQIRL